MANTVKADSRHQKHQALITRHCKYIRTRDIKQDTATIIFKKKNKGSA